MHVPPYEIHKPPGRRHPLFLLLFAQIEPKLNCKGNVPPPQEKQQKPRGLKNKYPSKGQTFPVTTKLLRVTIRPLTHQTESNLLRTILISHVRRKVTVLLNGPNFKPLHGGIFGLALPSVQDLTWSETK